MQIVSAAPSAAPAPVDVRPLAATAHGRLALAAPDPFGYHHVSAASGLAVAGGAAWIVSDEYGALARFGSLTEPGTLHPGLQNQKPKRKPDLESMIALPDADGGATLVALGSGSAKDGTRAGALVQAVDGAGRLAGPPRRVDLAPLYADLEQRLPKGLNIEGVALHGAELLLFHRGKIAGDVNTIFRLDAERAVDALRTGRALSGDLVLGSRAIELGALNGERLGFADAFALDDGSIAFVASAEGDDGPGGNGAILGSVLGVLDANLDVTALRPLDGPPRKVEGMVPSRLLDPRATATEFTLVTDPDDPAQAAEVLTVDLAR